MEERYLQLVFILFWDMPKNKSDNVCFVSFLGQH